MNPVDEIWDIKHQYLTYCPDATDPIWGSLPKKKKEGEKKEDKPPPSGGLLYSAYLCSRVK